MKLLVIDGGVFLGRAVVAAALNRGHKVTVFNRGKISANDEARVTWQRGDRDDDLAMLRAGEWDAVIDMCGYAPRQVRALLAALRGRIGHYPFVSTVAAYADIGRVGLREKDVLVVAAGGRCGDRNAG